MLKQNCPQKITLFQFGPPLESLYLEDIEVVKPGPLQVGIKLLAAPINPADLGTIMGSYGQLPKLPAVPGREGVGEIYEIGESIDESLLGKRVRMPFSSGSWRETIVVDIHDLIFVPADISVEMAAMAFINPPTAWCLLHDLISLKPGDWIVQNAANSAVGILIIQLARHFGFKTINIVRDLSLWEEPLKKIGADIVVQDDSDWYKNSAHSGLPKLALNSVGGRSALNLLSVLAPEGVHVTFGGMTRDAVTWPTRDLLFKNVTLKGFALARYFGTPKYSEILNSIFDFIKKGIINTPVEKSYLLRDFKDAISQAQAYHRTGKILLKSDWVPRLG